MLVSCGKLDDFRLCCGPAKQVGKRQVAISNEMKKHLNVDQETPLRMATLFPSDMDDLMFNTLRMTEHDLGELTVSEARVFSDHELQTNQSVLIKDVDFIGFKKYVLMIIVLLHKRSIPNCKHCTQTRFTYTFHKNTS